MASETVPSDHSAPCEEVGKEVQSEVKKIDEDVTESVEKTEAEESTCPEGASEAKIEKKQQIELPAIEDTENVGKPKAGEEKIEDKPVKGKTEAVAPLAESDKEKVEDGPIVDDSDKVIEKAPPETAIDCNKEEKSEEPEPDEKKEGEETAKVVDVPESLPSEDSAPESSAKDLTVCKEEETSHPHPIVEQKPPEEIKEEEICSIEGSDQVKGKDPITKVEEKHVQSGEGNEVTQPTEATGLSEDKPVEPGKNEAETEAPEEKSVVAGECDEKPTDVAKSSTTENVTRELEKIEAEEKIEQTVQPTEAKLVDEKIEENVQPVEAKEEEKQVCEPAKTEVENPECPKDVPEEGIPVKTQKPSFVKIVKQSLVKAKKAIIGKSHHSKTPASEPKDDDGNK